VVGDRGPWQLMHSARTRVELGPFESSTARAVLAALTPAIPSGAAMRFATLSLPQPDNLVLIVSIALLSIFALLGAVNAKAGDPNMARAPVPGTL